MNADLKVADAIRKVTASMERAIEEGHRSRWVNADDLIEVLLAIADESFAACQPHAMHELPSPLRAAA